MRNERTWQSFKIVAGYWFALAIFIFVSLAVLGFVSRLLGLQ